MNTCARCEAEGHGSHPDCEYVECTWCLNADLEATHVAIQAIDAMSTGDDIRECLHAVLNMSVRLAMRRQA